MNIFDPSWKSGAGRSGQETPKQSNHAYGIKLIRYLSGGGLAALTRSAEEERADAKQVRFLVVAAIVGLAWLVLWVA